MENGTPPISPLEDPELWGIPPYLMNSTEQYQHTPVPEGPIFEPTTQEIWEMTAEEETAVQQAIFNWDNPQENNLYLDWLQHWMNGWAWKNPDTFQGYGSP